jgi:hypothetical protein
VQYSKQHLALNIRPKWEKKFLQLRIQSADASIMPENIKDYERNVTGKKNI